MSKQNLFGEELTFDLPINKSASIKVIGVGGGGTNAVNYMFQEGIKGVDFVICNTDAQALNNSPIPNKIQLGATLTEGLGAGANPEIGKQAALESAEHISEIIASNTKMVFITAGMGGGTGSGAAPIIASIAKKLDILTVGIVTLPFFFEGKKRAQQAKEGVEKLREKVDSLIIINNEKLRELYGNLGFKQGFAKADTVLATAAKAIAEVITHHFTQNIDLHDVKTVLASSGTAIMGSATASGDNRSCIAIAKALDSPLLNNNKITGATNVLLLIISGEEEITIDEIGEINDYVQVEAGNNANIIMGIGEDDQLGNEISVIVIATGFPNHQQDIMIDREEKKVYHTLDEDQPVTQILNPSKDNSIIRSSSIEIETVDKELSELLPKVQQLEFEKTDSCAPTDQPLEEEEEKSRQMSLDFDLSPDDTKETIKKHHLNEEKKPLEESKIEFEDNKEKEEELIQFDVHTVEKEPAQKNIEKIDDCDSVSPFEQSISEVEKKNAEERKKRLSSYNYKFKTIVSDKKDILEEPAFKRKGVDLNEEPEKISRFTLNMDEDNEIELNDDNSFLYDNVD